MGMNLFNIAQCISVMWSWSFWGVFSWVSHSPHLLRLSFLIVRFVFGGFLIGRFGVEVVTVFVRWCACSLIRISGWWWRKCSFSAFGESVWLHLGHWGSRYFIKGGSVGCVVYVLVTGGCLFGIRYPVWRLVLIMSLGIFGFEHFCFSYWLIVSSDRRCSLNRTCLGPIILGMVRCCSGHIHWCFLLFSSLGMLWWFVMWNFLLGC